MRIDKYLWCIRVFKSRALATEACNKNRVELNGTVAKASKEVMPSDIIKVRKNQIIYTYEVIGIPKSRVGAKLVLLYAVDKTPQDELNKLERINEDQSYYRMKGEGRPTKKDRRSLDDYLDSDDYDF